MVLSGDLKRMKRVLKRMEYISNDEIVLMKGKVACEISAGDELMVSYNIYAYIDYRTTC